jgi:hypothetical protein
MRLMLRRFSREHGYVHLARHTPRHTFGLDRVRGFAYGPYIYPLKRTIPSVRGTFTSPSLHRSHGACRNINRLSIGYALRLHLRPRLTLGRLALPRNPWSIGGRIFHPPCRYLYLHLLFQPLQCTSPCTFAAVGMLPYRTYSPPSFGSVLDARLLSTPCRSTSELLRTL